MSDAEDYKHDAEVAVLERRCPAQMKNRFARNRERDAARRRGLLFENTEAEPTTPRSIGPADCLIARETAARLRQLARRCSRRQRHALLLSIRGLKNCSIALRLRVSEATVSRDLQHIRKILAAGSI